MKESWNVNEVFRNAPHIRENNKLERKKGMLKIIISAVIFINLGIGLLEAQIAINEKNKNLLPNPGFEEFNGDVPVDWEIESQNQEILKEKLGKGKPGHDGTGSCLEFRPGNIDSDVAVRSTLVPVCGNAHYVFKGYYRSECEKVVVTGSWYDSGKKAIGSKFKLVLPETQGKWIEFFDEASSPNDAKYLELELRKKWESKRVCFDDLSLRAGKLLDYEKEFSVTGLPDGQWRFPIYASQNPHPSFGAQYDKDRFHAEYALAGFTMSSGANGKFGLKITTGLVAKKNDQEIVALGKDPNVWGFQGKDEPGVSDLPALGIESARVRQFAPSKDYYVNLFPIYAFKTKIEYEDYVQNFIDTVKPRFFSHDSYVLKKDGGCSADAFFSNLEIVRRLALQSHVDFGVLLCVLQHGPFRSSSEIDLKWQAYCTLVYGSKFMGWFTYLLPAPSGDWNWKDAVIDREGNRTRHYSMIKRLNHEILSLGPTLLRLRSTGVFFTNPNIGENTGTYNKVGDGKVVRNISGETGEGLIVGEFSDEKNISYIMVVNRDFKDSQNGIIEFYQTKKIFECSKQTGEWMPLDNVVSATEFKCALDPGEGRLFKME